MTVIVPSPKALGGSAVLSTSFSNKGTYLTELLRILRNIAGHFGSLSSSIVSMHETALDCLQTARDPVAVVLTENNSAVLELVHSKLDRLVADPNTPHGYSALYK